MLSVVIPALVFLLINCAILIPQLSRIAKGRCAAGVSLAGLTSGSIGYSAWIVYSVQAGELVAAVAFSLPALLQVATTLLAFKHGGEKEGLRLPVLLLVALVVGYLVGGWGLYSIVLVSNVVWSYAPSIWSAWRASSVEGIAVATWILAASSGAVWMFIGTVNADAAYFASGFGNFALSMAVVLIVVRRRHGDRTLSVLDPAASAQETSLEAGSLPIPSPRYSASDEHVRVQATVKD